jgi:hypothetical protein
MTEGLDAIGDVLAAGEALVDRLIGDGEDQGAIRTILESDVALAIGAGLLLGGSIRYMALHPELVQASIQQVGQSLEIGASSGSSSIESLLVTLAPVITAGVGALGLATATVIPGVPPPP